MTFAQARRRGKRAQRALASKRGVVNGAGGERASTPGPERGRAQDGGGRGEESQTQGARGPARLTSRWPSSRPPTRGRHTGSHRACLHCRPKSVRGGSVRRRPRRCRVLPSRYEAHALLIQTPWSKKPPRMGCAPSVDCAKRDASPGTLAEALEEGQHEDVGRLLADGLNALHKCLAARQQPAAMRASDGRRNEHGEV